MAAAAHGDSGAPDGQDDRSEQSDACTSGVDLPQAPESGIAHIVVTNTTGARLTAFTEPAGQPSWLQVNGVSLEAYGGHFCCVGGHEDPFLNMVTLMPGDTVTFDWRGDTYVAAMDGMGTCIETTFVAPGPYAAHACAYAGMPPAWPWNVDAGTRTCVDFSINLPMPGTTVNVDASF